MHITVAYILALGGLAVAQSSSSSVAGVSVTSSAISPTQTSGCGHAIDLIIKSCLESTTALLNDCGPNDWACKCTQVQNVLTCYNNCANDPNAFGVQQEKIQWCNAAKAYSSTAATSNSTGHAATTMSSATISGSATATSGGGLQSGFATGSESAPATASATTGTSGAGTLKPATGLLAAIFGLALL